MLKGFLAAVASAFALIALFACSACYDGGDFSKMEYCFKGVQSIRIEAADRAVNVERCDADGVRVECFESETEYYSAAQEGGSLSIELVRDKEWTDFIGTQPNSKWRVVTVYVPERLESLYISTTNEDIELNGVCADSVEARCNGGGIGMRGVEAESLTFYAKNGDIRGSISGDVLQYAVQIDIKKGDCNLAESGRGERSLSLECNNGDIHIVFEG